MNRSEREKTAVGWVEHFIQFPHTEGPEIWHAIASLDKLNGRIPELEREFIKLLKNAAPVTVEELTTWSSWRWHAHEIIKGAYPLENLPAHVRDLAREMYYR